MISWTLALTTPWATTAPLIATGLSRAERLRAMGKGLNTAPSSTELLWFAFSAVALIALLLFMRTIFLKPEAKPKRRGPDLFDRALRELDLSRDDRDILSQVARAARLTDPAAILLSPANLAHALDRLPIDNEGNTLRRQVNSVSVRLFERPLPSPKRSDQ